MEQLELEIMFDDIAKRLRSSGKTIDEIEEMLNDEVYRVIEEMEIEES